MAPISAVAPSFLNDFLPKFGIEKKILSKNLMAQPRTLFHTGQIAILNQK